MVNLLFYILEIVLNLSNMLNKVFSKVFVFGFRKIVVYEIMFTIFKCN